MLRCAVMLALKVVGGAANGAAIVSPLRARNNVSNTDDTVFGSTAAKFNGRDANFANPLTAIWIWLASPTPSTGSGGGASASVLHSCDIKFAPVTPSTEA